MIVAHPVFNSMFLKCTQNGHVLSATKCIQKVHLNGKVFTRFGLSIHFPNPVGLISHMDALVNDKPVAQLAMLNFSYSSLTCETEPCTTAVLEVPLRQKASS